MRVLILSCNTGQGHNSCAAAIKEAFEARGATCEVVDALGFVSAGFSRAIAAWHVRIYRYCPRVFAASYRYSEQHADLFQERSLVYRLLTLGRKRLLAYLQAGNYDLVLCTHVFSALMLTDALKAKPLPLRTGFVATDYTCSPSTAQSEMDVYFIPSPRLTREFVQAGIAAERVQPVGIPVRQAFRGRTEKGAAKAHFGIAPEHRHLVVMSGSMGCGPIVVLARLIARRLRPDQEMTIVCGTNERLYQQLSRRYAAMPQVHVRGYVNDVPRLLDSADCYLTKPGGISVTEAAAKRVPMVLIDAVSGCELYNGAFYEQIGAALTAPSRRQLAIATVALLDDPARLARMAAAYGEGENDPAQAIYDHFANPPSHQ